MLRNSTTAAASPRVTDRFASGDGGADLLLGYAGDHALDFLDAGLFGVDVRCDDLAAPHHHNAVDHLENVMDVVGDEDAGMSGIPGIAHEAQHPLRLCDAEIVGRLV